MKRGRGKFCPRCGTQNNVGDAYCIKCGYGFKGRKKKSSLKSILILIIILAAGWIILRTFLKKPIIPTELIDIIKNMSASKAG
ncbi:Uncharacterised protein [uncultured archaeon]|nr:Uncharacterised protein [uncultured archaeon]